MNNKTQSRQETKRVNGHAGANGSTLSCAPATHELGNAGSDDASVFSVANAPSSGSPAGADRKATADLAESAATGRLRRDGAASGSEVDAGGANVESTRASQPDTKTSAKRKDNPFAEIPPGRKALPANGEAFVNAVHCQVDLVQLEVALLRDEDAKVVQRELAYLRELRYGKRAPVAEDQAPEIIFDAPRPERKPS
jgi:hypothetical protein